MSATDAEGVAAALRRADPDRFFSTLVLPPEARQAVQALYAFNVEIAQVRDRVRDPAAGEIRLQWWIDAIEGEARGEVRANRVAAALLDAVARFGLPAPALIRLLRARRFDLYDDPMPDLETFDGYAGETASVLLQLAAMILNGGAAVPNGDPAGHLGVAQALVGHLRAFGLNASKGRLFLPAAIFTANGVRLADIRVGRQSAELGAALRQIAEVAGGHLESARDAITALPAPLRPAFALLPVLERQLRLLRPDRAFAPPRDLPDWRKIALIGWWAWRQGRGPLAQAPSK